MKYLFDVLSIFGKSADYTPLSDFYKDAVVGEHFRKDAVLMHFLTSSRRNIDLRARLRAEARRPDARAHAEGRRGSRHMAEAKIVITEEAVESVVDLLETADDENLRYTRAHAHSAPPSRHASHCNLPDELVSHRKELIKFG